ncbi:MAG: hypothetical protein ACFFDQ_12925 [Candidatus Thorarchaeota archaeon]
MIGVYAIVTVAVILMAAWTQTIGNTVLAGRAISATADFDISDGVPMNGNITITSHSTMMESRPTWISYNISLEFPSDTPMNLRVDMVHFVFTKTDFWEQPSGERTIETVLALSQNIEIVNATSVIMYGNNLQIIPKMLEGNASGFLGCIIEFHSWEYGHTPPSITTLPSGTVGVIQLRPFTIIPAYLAEENWFFAMEAFLLVWAILIVYFVCTKAKT